LTVSPVPGLASLIAAYAAVDLVLYNRRQKRAWIDRELERLHEARQAFVRGDATPAQLHLLQQERAGDAIVEKKEKEKERNRRESWWGRGKAMLFGGKDDEEEQTERYGRKEKTPSNIIWQGPVDVKPGERLLEEERWVTNDEKQGKSVTEAVKGMVEGRRRDGEKEIEHTTGLAAGPLDVLAGNVAGAVKENTREATSWLNWGRGKDHS
jgi:hypothetical protein